MSKIKIEFKNGRKVIGRTSKQLPKTLQADETVYVIEIESDTMNRVVKIDKLDSRYQYLYFITKKSARLPKDKEIFRFYLCYDDGMYFDTYETFAFDRQNMIVSQITLMDEGLCWLLMNKDTDDDEYIDSGLLEEVVRERFDLGNNVVLEEYFEVEEIVW